MSRLPVTVVAFALMAAGVYVLRDALGCMAGTLAEECHVFFGITVNGGVGRGCCGKNSSGERKTADDTPPKPFWIVDDWPNLRRPDNAGGWQRKIVWKLVGRTSD